MSTPLFLNNNNAKSEEKFSIIEGDIAYRCITKKNIRCLVLNSEIGNICENLSKIFEQVFSIEQDKQKLSIQKIRFNENEIKNVILVRADFLILPFPKEYFDLVIYNGINFQDKDKVLKCFKEIKRVLKPLGCFCVGTINKFGLKILHGKSADSVKEMYADSYNGYISIFNDLKFQVRSYWTIGTFRRPYFIGNMDDGILLQWLYSNLEKFLPINLKLRIITWVLKKSGVTLNKILIKLFAPSFLFYCYKDVIPSGFEEMILEKTGFRHVLQQIRFNKVSFILFDSFGKPKKKLSCKRTNYDLTEDIAMINYPPKSKFSEEKLVMADWAEGKTMDVQNVHEVRLVTNWLINFQTKTSNEFYNLEMINNEIKTVRKNLDKIKGLKSLPFQKWLIDYSNHISKMKIRSTTVHGDFNPHNILVNMNNSLVTVIDWESFYENGNPFYDLTKLIYHVLTPNSCVDEFMKNIRNVEEIPSLVIIKEILTKHFQNEINVVTLLRFYFLNDLALNKNINKPYFLKLLEELSKIY